MFEGDGSGPHELGSALAGRRVLNPSANDQWIYRFRPVVVEGVRSAARKNAFSSRL